MKLLRKTATTIVTGLGVLMFVASPGFAGGSHGAANDTMSQPAHMSQGRDGTLGRQYGPMEMMGPGMVGSNMMGNATVQPGMGMVQPCPYGTAQDVDKDLSADDVRLFLERSLAFHGNKRLMVGDVKEAGDDTIVADIVTVDDSLVQRLQVDRHTGRMQQVN